MTLPVPQSLASALAADFEVEREIGRGGMGVVYLARDVKLDRPVAIKVLPEALAGSSEVRQRFLREARTAARLSHPNIVPIYRADEIGGMVFFVMAWVDGESLAERLAREGALAPLDVARLMREVALALGYAHAHGVVHRDVKPENILVEQRTGRPLVTDFGIARLAEAAPLTATGQVLGTVHYMSPEQVSGDALDGRSDIYALGVLGFRALTGRLPFDSVTASAVLVAHVTKPAPPIRSVAPAMPRELADVVDRCLAKDPAARFETAGALAGALDEAMRAMGERPTAAAVISEREAEALFARAARLQANTGAQSPPVEALAADRASAASDRRTLTSGYRLTDVRAAAEEAGISARHVERAAAELGLAREGARTGSGSALARVADRAPARNPFLGAATGIVIEVEVPGEMPERDLDMIVDVIRRYTGEPGMIGTIGRTLSWSMASQRRRLQVTVSPRGGRTTIRVDERLGQLAGGLFGGIIGGGGGGSGGIAMGIGVGALHSVGLAFAIWGGIIAGCYTLARTLFTSIARKRQAELRAMTDEIAALVAASVEGG